MAKDYIPISFSKKQIIGVSEHTDPHVLDKTTGSRAKIAKILLNSLDKRIDNFSFGIDSKGIDRDKRGAYINIPEAFIKDDTKHEGRAFFYLDAKRELTVHFSGIRTGETVKGKDVYDTPESVSGVKPNDIRKCFGLGEYKAREAKKQVKDKTQNKQLESKQQQNKKRTQKDLER